jgi:ArsR family transcriptional regulator, arsenate/arsenite/antimonite-responsive transcriptional repressor
LCLRDKRWPHRIALIKKTWYIESMTSAATSSTARAAQLFHALSDQIRLDVLELLQGGERCVCELMAELDMAQSRLSWHLKTLSDAGIVTARREGRWNYYSLHQDALAEAEEYLDAVRKPTRRASRNVVCCD